MKVLPPVERPVDKEQAVKQTIENLPPAPERNIAEKLPAPVHLQAEAQIMQVPTAEIAMRETAARAALMPETVRELPVELVEAARFHYEQLSKPEMILPHPPAARAEIITTPIAKPKPVKAAVRLPAVPKPSPLQKRFEIPERTPTELPAVEISAAEGGHAPQPELIIPLSFEAAAEAIEQPAEFQENIAVEWRFVSEDEAVEWQFMPEDLPFGLAETAGVLQDGDEGKFSLPPLTAEYFDFRETIETEGTLAEIPVLPVQEFAVLLGFMDEVTEDTESADKVAEGAAMQPEKPIIYESVPEIPTICVELTEKFNALDPEPAKVAEEMLTEVVTAVERVIELRMSGSKEASNAEQELEELCVELFEYLGIEYTPETVMEFVHGIMSTRQYASEQSQPAADGDYEEGTHEKKQDDDQNTGFLNFLSNHPVISKIGKLAIC